MNESSFHLKFEELRKKAEELLKERDSKSSDFSEMDIVSLIQELEIHQIELQVQNEELRHSRQELEASQKAYSVLYELAPMGYVTLSKEGVIVQANLTAGKILQVPKRDLVGRGFSKFIHPEDRKAYFMLVREVSAGEEVDHTGEIRLLRVESVPFYARVEVAPSRDASGLLTGWLLIFTDISDIKRAEDELKLYAERLERSNRELQDFAFIASHDLREPLRKIQAFGDILRTQYAKNLDAEGADYLERMCSAAGRLQSMVRGLLEYSRVVTRGAGFNLIDLGRVVDGAIMDLEWQIEDERAAVVREDLPAIEADSDQMHQLFQNLLSNALKFRGKEPPYIRIYARPDQSSKDSGQRWQIFIEDNGIGFEEQYAERIFALFERLHGRSEYEGSGMGLAICRRIAERHGGTITAHALPGKGATFIVTLPARQQDSA